ncbi:LysR family transcriptional regulator [Methylobacterium oryzisoli]|uniref:LysR family transcriptional regulator n=1 Tax=Methylobacterium oryzisoli TaxID=3385502 RepID=UPI00389232B8
MGIAYPIAVMDLHGVDLNLLVAFDALIAERSVTRAGKRIGRTQPAMSAALARLRSLFQDELLVRGSTGLQPTPRALDLAEPVSRALAEIQRALDFTHAFEPSTSPYSLTLAVSEHPAYVLLPTLIERLRDVAPNIALHVVGVTARDDAVSILDAGEADLSIGVPPTVSVGARIITQSLFEERFVCVVRRDHPVAAQPLNMETFLALGHLLVSPEGERYGKVDEALAEKGLKRRLGLTLPQMYVAPMLVAKSDMIATLMSGVVAASRVGDQLTILDPPLDLPSPVFAMSWHRRSDAHPVHRWFRELVASLSVANSS